MLNMTWEFKLEPTAEQVAEIERTLTVCRQVWNFALAERKDWLNSRKSPVNACSINREYILPADQPFPNYVQQAKALTQAEKQIPDLGSVNAQMLQQTLRKLEVAWESWLLKRSGLPRFKNQARMRSFVFPQMLKNPLSDQGIKLPQLGWVKVRWSREIPALCMIKQARVMIKQARVVRKASRYFVLLSLQADVDIPEVPFQGHPLGIDVGLEYFLSTSDGLQVKRPRFFNELHRQLKSLQRRLRQSKRAVLTVLSC